jgi:CheY-like chemotaxis protein
MRHIQATDPEWIDFVRGALANLYDYAYLENHALALHLAREAEGDRLTKAQWLRRALLDCIEALQPNSHKAVGSEGARAYAILTYRYVDGLSIEEAAGRLALSRRQAYREHDKGIKAVASLLADRLPVRQESGGTLRSTTQIDVAREEVGRLRQAEITDTLDLGELVEGVIALLEPLALAKQADIVVETTTWPAVIGDRVMLRQALLGLLGRALDHATGGQIRLRCDLRQGCAIEIVATASKAAEKLPGSNTEVNVEVARSLIESQGGQVQAEFTAEGATIRICLPSQEQATLLVIDDNADMIALLQRYLGGHDISVIGARTADEALSLAADACPKLILLDIMMPHVDGWEILQRLQALPQTQETPIVICSVLNQKEMALAMGASDYITKPVSQTDLLRTVRHWLGPLRPDVSPPEATSEAR